MKRYHANLKFIITVSALLFSLILIQSIFDYRSSRDAVENLMKNQAEALILSVARAGEKGLIAYQIQQRKITDHLMTFARSLAMLEKEGNLGQSSLVTLYGSDNLRIVELWDRRGNPERKLLTGDDSEIDRVSIGNSLAPLFSGQSSELRLGLIDCGGKRAGCLAVAVRKSDGGAVLAGIDSDELLTLRRTFGTGSVIDHISESPGVEYAAVTQSGSILAASRKYPAERVDPWITHDKIDSMRTRIYYSGDNKSESVFEIISPFNVADKNYGSIVVGLNTAYLDLLTNKLRRDILWRSILFLIVAVIATTVVTTRQNFRLLSEKYNEIKNEVQKLEANRFQNERLTAMGELASGVAHEVRNPLNAIRVIIQRIQREFTPTADHEEYHDLTGLLINETDRINDTVEQFLKFARPPVIHKVAGDIKDCLSGIISLIEPRISEKGCRLEKNLGDIPEFAFDPELLKQGIINLLDNALNAVDRDGLIRMRVFRQTENCVIEIEDNGPGVSDENKNRVFDMYFTTRDTGTGMGLPTVLRIVKEHSGTVQLLDSNLGGALFRLELPIE